ncbi:MAG TPA: succinate dehydrogenase, cytochrome b556 subunit [Steroidobacteraceae bacterium]|nr:succinate dehydrogenase, cytochrome b556 subunit [Steroidobacteraceae bacterium]
MRERPLSPHLSVYKFKYTLTTSILNRFTGLILSLGLLVLVYWLMAVATGPGAYAQASEVLSHGVFKLIYLGLLAAFCYHLVAGVRHLIWDTGSGMERLQARRSAWIVVGVSLLLFIGLGYWLVLALERAA